ncbi:MAG: indolepyruvate ferredoxin oxidoreductase family protein [Gemmatimonadetes bacterium]|nr:indolepyruvate ferredoxin oxidoreductase family protein [Gemmatimonadota bacterium]
MTTDSLPAPSLRDRYLKNRGPVFLTGIHAIVRFLLEKQRRDALSCGAVRRSFIAGYEGSPLGGLDLELRQQAALLNEAAPFVHQAAVNEKTAAAAVHGSQYEGNVDGFWYGKAHGVKWALDEFSLANIAGTGKDSGVVLFCGDDHMAKSSGYPASSEQALRDARIPVFYPSTVSEVITYAHHALALSRYAGVLCGLKLVTPICDGAETVDVNPELPSVTLPPGMPGGRPGQPVRPYEKRFHQVVISTQSVPFEEELTTIRMEIAAEYARANGIDTVENTESDCPLGIVATGKSYADIVQALRLLNLEDQVPILKLGVIYPVNPRTIREFAGRLQTLVVLEEKGPFVEEAVAHALLGTGVEHVHGKRGPGDRPLIPAYGELNPDLLTQRLGPMLQEIFPSAPIYARMEELTSIAERDPGAFARRTAHYCPGCPHSVSARAPEGEVAGGEIGCSSLDAYIEADGRGVRWIPTMGLGGAIYNGMFPFNGNRHLFQNIGDGTVLHSGLITIFSSISHGANVTYKVLWNHVVAMTGGQDITGQPTLDDFALILLGMGVQDVTVVSKFPERVSLKRARAALKPGQNLLLEPRDGLESAQESLSRKPGVKVLVYDQECATEHRRRRKRQRLAPERYVFIHERVCEGCGDCGQQSMCLALEPRETEFGPKTAILQSACNQDLSCLKGDCPSFVSVEPVGDSRPLRAECPLLDDSDLQEPGSKTAIEGEYAIHLIGIGGTGVVTVAHLLAVAALFDGKKVSEMNRTGLAQKGGPVESPIILGEGEVPPSSYIPAGRCDLYLAADIAGAVNPLNLQAASAHRTVAVVSRSGVPTAKMVYDPQVPGADVPAMEAQIEAHTRSVDNVFIDAQDYAMKLFGNHIVANVFLLGVAYQAGHIPLQAGSIERAIRLNGQAVDVNIQAFRWGRMAVHDRTRLDGAVEEPEPGSDELVRRYARLLGRKRGQAFEAMIGRIPVRQESFQRSWAIRVAELIAFQDTKLAERFVDRIARVYEGDERVGGPDRGYLLTTHAAFMLHKLMAYKDEYEVARLLTDPSEPGIAERFDGPVRVSYHLHPPLLRAWGLDRKLRLGPWFRPFLRIMARCRFLRGTPFDPFGYTAARREERELVAWYESLLDQALAMLTPENYPEVSELLQLPDEIRGYEQVKHRSVLRVKKKADEMLETLLQGAASRPVRTR